jgi:hypothetical protein
MLIGLQPVDHMNKMNSENASYRLTDRDETTEGVVLAAHGFSVASGTAASTDDSNLEIRVSTECSGQVSRVHTGVHVSPTRTSTP